LIEKVKEGDMYKVITLCGEEFEIRYGYYENADRLGKYNDPIPIYPNLLDNPQYNNEGYRFVTEMQDTCKYFKGKLLVDICCGCKHFQKGDDLIGICKCRSMKRDTSN